MSEEESLDAEQLNGDVPIKPGPRPESAEPVSEDELHRQLTQAELTIKQAHAKQAIQNIFWRRIMFWGVSGSVVATLLASFAVMFWYIKVFGDNASPTVLSAWFFAIVAQALGLLAIITSHLFPRDHD